MRNILIFLSFLIFFQIKPSRSQTSLVDTNKTWYVATCIYYGVCNTNVYHFNGDTAIGNYQYKKLYYSADSTMQNWWYKGAMREDSTRKVFFYNYPNDFLYYDFALNLNDTFSTNINGCNIQMVVDSVDSVMLFNGELRRRLIFSPYNEVWIEGIGSLNGLLDVGSDHCTWDVINSLTCFKENDTLQYHNSAFSLCFYSVGINEINNLSTVSVFPSPSTNFLTIESPRLTSIEILNTQGQLMKTIATDSQKISIDVSTLPGGLYFVKIKTEYGVVVKKFMKQ